MAAGALNAIKHGGFARLGRETPCALALCREHGEYERSMILIDKNGERPVCASCRKLGPYMEAAPGVFICDSCARAAEDHLRQMMETVPELRDHRLKRWRTGCDCERCRSRANQAV